MGYFTYKSGVSLLIWACFNPEIDLKATKMAFMANSPGGIFSKVVFMLVPMDDYYPLPFISCLLFDLPRDISSHLWVQPHNVEVTNYHLNKIDDDEFCTYW